MSFPLSHKTVFVLDRGQASSMACTQMEFDFHRSRGGPPLVVPSAPVTKTMWTTAAEAALEYCRIVFDLAPEGKLIRFVVAGGGFESAAINRSVGRDLAFLIELCII